MKLQIRRVAIVAAAITALASFSLPSAAAINSTEKCGDKNWAGAGAAGCLGAVGAGEVKASDRPAAESQQLTLSIIESSGPSAPAVPEPETYALVLAGLGVVGLIARRRKIQG